MHLRSLLAMSVLGLGFAALPAATAPPLAPQAGPVIVNGDPRTVITGLPFTISTPGSYYLRKNLGGVAGSGITLLCGNVTIDLGGFTLHGGPGSQHGIDATLTGITDVHVKNGFIRDWGGSGIEGSGMSDATFEELHITACGGTGLNCGATSQLRRCVAQDNGSAGGGDGLAVGSHSVVADCVAIGNATDGIRVPDGARIDGCTASGNGRDGIFLSGGSSIVDSVARSNAAVGIHVPGTQASIDRCSATGNGSHGIEAGDGSHVADSCAVENLGHGFLLNDRTLITRCTASRNGLAGIRTQHRCLVLENCCTDNATGIEIYGGGSRVERNLCAENTVDGLTDRNGGGGTENLAISNSSHSNAGSDYFFPNGTNYASFFSPTPNFLSDQPWANFQ